MTYPSHVELCEVGPRDGFQYEEKPIPTKLKRDIITKLANAGLPRIQVTSFVHPSWVPQMADAEDLIEMLPPNDEVVYSGLVLNQKGMERALGTDIQQVDLSIATNEQHSKDNVNMSVDEGVQQAEEVLNMAETEGIPAQLGLQTVFGYDDPGDTPLERVVDICERFASYGVESISLADSTGMANPMMIKKRVHAVQDAIGDVPLVLHLHDTRGLGLANVMAALETGVRRFDTAMGGIGGCPFIPGATGNICTEDTVYLLESVGVETGVDMASVAVCSREMEIFLDKQFPGKWHHLPESA